MQMQKMEQQNQNQQQQPQVQDELVKIRGLQLEPNPCPLSAPLAITMSFSIAAPVKNAFWVLHYEADISAKRHLIPLFTSPSKTDVLPAGDHVFQAKIDGIPTQGVKEKYLLQVGMLKLELHSASSSSSSSSSSSEATSTPGGEPVVSVNMVTQVSKDGEGVLKRNVISPLEE